eukprot:jgi/Mesvir1/23808/Mv10621-RA.1
MRRVDHDLEVDADDIIRRAEIQAFEPISKPRRKRRPRRLWALLCMGILAALALWNFGFMSWSGNVMHMRSRSRRHGEGVHRRHAVDCTAPHKRILKELNHKKSVRMSWIFKAREPFQYAHMAMIERLLNGSLVAAFQVSSGLEGIDDQHIVVAFSHDTAGHVWGTPRPLPWPSGGAQWGPVLHRDEKGYVWLFYSESRNCQFNTSPPRWMPGGDILVTMWGHGGDFWKPPRVILPEDAGGRIPKVIANRMIVLGTGEWVLPFWREKHEDSSTCPAEGIDGSAGVLVSEDSGWTWEARGNVKLPTTWLIENTVVEASRNGHLLMFFRSQTGYIYSAKSTSQGRDWSIPEPTSLPNPDAKVHALRLDDGSLAMAFNNHAKLKGKHRRCRSNLDIALSPNDGRSWTKILRLEGTQDAGLRNHYPTMVQRDCTLFVAYSRFYHEEFAFKMNPNRTLLEFGIRLAAVDLSPYYT